MKIVCEVCGFTEEVSDEIKEEISEFRNKYGLGAISYIRMLNMIRGKCLNSDEHSFEFDEEFMNRLKEITSKDKADKELMDKLLKENGELVKSIEEFEANIRECQAKFKLNSERVEMCSKNRDGYVEEVEDLTGADDIEIWY